MTMMCTKCYLEGTPVPVGERVTRNSPFAFMIHNGESLCVKHMPAPPQGRETEAAIPMTQDIPQTFVPQPENIQTDNRYVVDESVTPQKKSAKNPQQRKRTKL